MQNIKKDSSPKKRSYTVLIICIIFIISLGLFLFGGYIFWHYFIKNKIDSLSMLNITKNPAPLEILKNTPTPTKTEVQPSLKKGSPINGFIIALSDSQLVSEAEIKNLTPWQLKIARNEIYARYGRPFDHKDLLCYFATQNWYQIDYGYSDTKLSSIENTNITLIQSYEDKINSPLASHDSGCN